MFNQESSGCFCLNICSQWLDFKNRSIEKIKAIFIFKKTNKTFLLCWLYQKRMKTLQFLIQVWLWYFSQYEDVLYSFWHFWGFFGPKSGDIHPKKIRKFFFNILFWTTYKTFHALFKKEKLLLICSSPHELCVYTQKNDDFV